ncbi:hypothetical protein ACH4FA_36995 [Streptomyces sp. NPDC017966]|uniref:hypothetical protein n=1 Tax=Streptomyces sp. NPDC017966 TaxID=3365023 RepID=UPI0037B5A7E1
MPPVRPHKAGVPGCPLPLSDTDYNRPDDVMEKDPLYAVPLFDRFKEQRRVP